MLSRIKSTYNKIISRIEREREYRRERRRLLDEWRAAADSWSSPPPPYDLAVNVMNQQTAALLAACGVLETWTGGGEMDYDAAVLALEMCGRAVAWAEAFPAAPPDDPPPLAERLKSFTDNYEKEQSKPYSPPNADLLAAVAAGDAPTEQAGEWGDEGAAVVANLQAIREYINKQANDNDAEAARLRLAIRSMTVRETFPAADEKFVYRDA